jgi:two-component system phosphate regulon sensor histidine kinase PhoR
MKVIASYTRKWLIYIITFFLLFASVLLISEFFHEKKFRLEALNEKLDNYTSLTESYISNYKIGETGNYSNLDTLVNLISNKAIRITLIDNSGRVLFDSQVKDAGEMESHFDRPEIQEAIIDQYGTDIRVSGTTQIKYYYYAKRFSDYFIRVSAVYDIHASRFIKPDRVLLMIIILGLLTATLAVLLITDKFGKSIDTLREFTLKALANKPIDEDLVFPENELGDIGQEIIEIYQKLNKTKEELLSEKAKLIRHLNLLDEGVAIFSKEMQVITSNNHFILFINHISDTRVFHSDF